MQVGSRSAYLWVEPRVDSSRGAEAKDGTASGAYKSGLWEVTGEEVATRKHQDRPSPVGGDGLMIILGHFYHSYLPDAAMSLTL